MIVAAFVPLFLLWSSQLNTALALSLICTLAALFAVGVVKGRLARMAIVTSGLQVAIIGSLSAGLGFAIGRIVNAIASERDRFTVPATEQRLRRLVEVGLRADLEAQRVGHPVDDVE